MKLGAFRLPWASRDPYWDGFINRPPSDPSNLVPPAVRAATEGQVFPVKADVHTPEVMSEHIKDLGRFFGADLVGVARFSPAGGAEYPFAIVCGIRAEYDPRESQGIGGQAAALTGAYVTFNLGAAIREYGFNATRSSDADVDRIAVAAGLGKLGPDGRLLASQLGSNVYVADVIRTDLPLSPDTEEVYEWVTPTS